MTAGRKRKYNQLFQLFNENDQAQKLLELRKKRKNNIDKRIKKIDDARELMQNVEPLYLDVFITAYHKKGITTEGKIDIFKELQKYFCDKSIKIFYKLNDSERNNQIRDMSFRHLQNMGMYVKLRKNFKGKKKLYMTEKNDFIMTPLDLLKKIELDNVQNKKMFDIFISHSRGSDRVATVYCKVNLNMFGFLNSLKFVSVTSILLFLKSYSITISPTYNEADTCAPTLAIILLPDTFKRCNLVSDR